MMTEKSMTFMGETTRPRGGGGGGDDAAATDVVVVYDSLGCAV
jgi:hypothetical protein